MTGVIVKNLLLGIKQKNKPLWKSSDDFLNYFLFGMPQTPVLCVKFIVIAKFLNCLFFPVLLC